MSLSTFLEMREKLEDEKDKIEKAISAVDELIDEPPIKNGRGPAGGGAKAAIKRRKRRTKEEMKADGDA